MSVITIGCDPEVFIQDGLGKIIPAVGLIGGSKCNPITVGGGALQEDNVLGEFNTDPADNYATFRDNIKGVMLQLENRVSPYKLKIISSHHFEKDVLKKAGRQALEFGCTPDINAWDGQTNESPSPYNTLRTAGGHVHVGFDVDKDDIQSRYNVIQLMDIYLGIPSVLLDGDVERRSLYGKAGACRVKTYGVEYRVLSNFWISSDEYIKWVYDQTQRAVDNKEYLGEILGKYTPDKIQDVINNSDIEGATSIVGDLQLELV